MNFFLRAYSIGHSSLGLKPLALPLPGQPQASPRSFSGPLWLSAPHSPPASRPPPRRTQRAQCSFHSPCPRCNPGFHCQPGLWACGTAPASQGLSPVRCDACAPWGWGQGTGCWQRKNLPQRALWKPQLLRPSPLPDLVLFLDRGTDLSRPWQPLALPLGLALTLGALQREAPNSEPLASLIQQQAIPLSLAEAWPRVDRVSSCSPGHVLRGHQAHGGDFINELMQRKGVHFYPRPRTEGENRLFFGSSTHISPFLLHLPSWGSVSLMSYPRAHPAPASPPLGSLPRLASAVLGYQQPQ